MRRGKKEDDYSGVRVMIRGKECRENRDRGRVGEYFDNTITVAKTLGA